MLITKKRRVVFDPEEGGIRSETVTVHMPRRIRRNSVTACINGFDAKFTNSDKELHRLIIDVDVVDKNDRSVEVKIAFGLRDRSGSWDDLFSGWVQFIVIAESA